MPEDSDDLTRAIDLSIEFELREGEKDVEAFLREHESLRRILEPLLADEPEPERKILGDFELVRELGRGGMGVVYEAIQTLLGRTVALKLLPPHRALSPRSLAMFRREATLAASLDHPGIAKVLELQEVDGQLVLAMEMIEGRPLEDVLEVVRETHPGLQPGTLTARDITPAADSHRDGDSTWGDSYEAAATELVRQVADALAHAHSRGVVHRDVKPGNILITPEGTAVLTDFGLAREEGMRGVTHHGEFAGTYRYSAPEQLEGRSDEIDGRTDVYALGATLYELLTLHHPIDADSVTEMITRVRQEDPVPPSRINPRVNSDLEAVVLCALEKDRNRRYASAEEFATDLAHVLERTPVKARRLSLPGRATRWVRRNRLVSAFVVTLLVSTALISILAANTARAERRATDHLQRYENLSVGAVLDALYARAAAAHPPWPSRSAELRELVRISEQLLHERSAQRVALADLRAGNMLVKPAARAASRPPHPAVARISMLRGTVAQLTLEAGMPRVSDTAKREALAEVADMRREISELEAVVTLSNRVQITDEKASALHDRIEDQLFRLRDVESTLVPDLEFRLAWSESVRGRAPQGLWQEVATRVAVPDGKYRTAFAAKPLVPQIGLVPLGSDPKSGLEEFVHLLSGDVPKRVDGRLEMTEASGIVFVLMPGGTHRAPEGSRTKWEVELAPFFIAKHEMSRAQWERLARGLPGLRWRDGGVADVRNHGQMMKPVNGIPWVMCDGLFARCGIELPTAAQWGYAVEFDGGVANDWKTIARVANLLDAAYVRGAGDPNRNRVPYDDKYYGLAPIDTMDPTPAGLHHMLGNVKEWCRDHFLGRGMVPRAGDGLREIEAGRNALRILSGGHWQGTSPWNLFDNRLPTGATRSTGVRPVRRLSREQR